MPELGDYAGYVLSAYAGALALLALITVASLVRARKIRVDLEKVERDG